MKILTHNSVDTGECLGRQAINQACQQIYTKINPPISALFVLPINQLLIRFITHSILILITHLFIVFNFRDQHHILVKFNKTTGVFHYIFCYFS